MFVHQEWPEKRKPEGNSGTNWPMLERAYSRHRGQPMLRKERVQPVQEQLTQLQAEQGREAEPKTDRKVGANGLCEDFRASLGSEWKPWRV